MQLVTALTLANRHAPHVVGSGTLAQLLPPEFLGQCLEQAGVTTIRRRRLPLESLVMLLIGMALYRKMDAWVDSQHHAAALPGKRVLTALQRCPSGASTLG